MRVLHGAAVDTRQGSHAGACGKALPSSRSSSALLTPDKDILATQLSRPVETGVDEGASVRIVVARLARERTAATWRLLGTRLLVQRGNSCYDRAPCCADAGRRARGASGHRYTSEGPWQQLRSRQRLPKQRAVLAKHSHAA